MSQSSRFTIRIRTEQGQDFDWSVQPNEVTFLQALEVISKILPDTTVTAFQYVDDDGEKITVRSDEELNAMLEMYFCDFSEENIEKGLIPPLIIFPRVGKTAKDRNRLDLKINTQKTSLNKVKSSEKLQHLSVSSQSMSDGGNQLLVQPSQIAGSQQNISGISPGSQTRNNALLVGAQQQMLGVSPGSHGRVGPQLHGQGFSLGTQQNMSGLSPGSLSRISTHQFVQDNAAGTQSRAENIKEILTCGRIMINDLQEIGLLGIGNGGQVYKCFHVPTQRFMAVKVIQLAVDIEIQKKILLELEILYKCHSASIIGFYGAFFIDNRISLCTEYMDGGSLDKYGKIPEDVLGRMTVRIVQGLLYMWSLKILHRDIKPSNILVNTQGDVKLCDFGVSTQLVDSKAATYVGTNAYMAPERLKAENYGAPSEIWSLGVTVFELVTGEFPFKDVISDFTLIKVFNTILFGTPPVLPVCLYSPEICDFTSRCMQITPENRITHQELLTHPFLQKYASDDRMSSVLSSWITSRLTVIQRPSIPCQVGLHVG